MRTFSALIQVLVASLLLASTGCEADGAASTDASVDAAPDAIPFDPAADPYAGNTAGVTARFEPAASDWHALPFPIDSRRLPSGLLDLSGFPPAREGDFPGIVQEYLDVAAQVVKGFSIQPTLYVQLAAPVGPPPSPLETTAWNSRTVLMDITPQSPTYGRQLAMDVAVSANVRAQHLVANLVMAHPVWGQPLRPNTTYAFVVRRSWPDTAGQPLGQPEALTRVLGHVRTQTQATDPKEQALVQALAPLQPAIDSGTLKVAWADIAAATVFTTGDPTAELRQMANWVKAKAPVAAAIEWKKLKDTKDYTLLEAKVLGPDFQIGTCPYDTYPAGGFAFEANGDPVVQKTMPLRVAVALPKKRSLEVGGKLPVVLSTHGTGGDYLSFTSGGSFVIAKQLLPFGLPIVSIDQPLHGPRCEPEITGTTLDLMSFNFLNIAAGRSTFRQGALDQVYVSRLLREGMLNVPAEFTPDGKAMDFDPIRLTYIGHSQGGLTGALQAGVDDQLRSYVLSGAGAGLSLTILLRKDPADISNLLTSLLGLDAGELSPSHPIISLVQMLADATDPLAYAPHVFDRPAGVRPPDMLLTEGLNDAQTPAATAEALSAAMGLGLLTPVVQKNTAMQVAKPAVLSSPAKNNLQFGDFAVTGIHAQFGNDDHFAIFDNGTAAKLYQGFLLGSVSVGEAVADTRP